VRVGLHLLIHRLLRLIMLVLRIIQSLLERWLRRNKEIARSVQVARTESHLSAIAEHKHSNALSEAEKQALKDRSLLG
jgi:Mg2+/Co2+ transporter CorB